MILIVLTLGALNFFWGEKVPAGGGFGWDGVVYAGMVRNLGVMISGGQLSSYYAQRILPSAVVRGMLLFSGTQMSATNIIRGFELYNLALLLCAGFVWKRVADKCSLSLAGRWLGFSGIFVNFESSKQAFYYPVLTDVTALCVAMLLLLFYVERKPVFLLATTIIGAFCWPVVSVCGAFLLIFLGAELPQEVISPPPSTFTFKSLTLPDMVKLAGLAVLVLSLVGYAALGNLWSVTDYACALVKNLLVASAQAIKPGAVPSLQKMPVGDMRHLAERLVTCPPAIVGLLVALSMLVGSGAFVRSALGCLRRARLPLVAMAVGAVVIPYGLIKAISNPGVVNPSSLFLLIKLIVLPPEGRFALPIVTLAVFWGPVALLLLLQWTSFCVEARKLGPGVVAVVGISLLLGMVGEPRFMTIAWPFLVLGFVLVFERSCTKASFKYVIAAFTLFYAQFWMKLNLAPWLPPDDQGILEFPKQLYFMHYGLWMSQTSYLMQLVFLVLTTFILHKTMFAAPSSSK